MPSTPTPPPLTITIMPNHVEISLNGGPPAVVPSTDAVRAFARAMLIRAGQGAIKSG
jgi:hypothetical protein